MTTPLIPLAMIEAGARRMCEHDQDMADAHGDAWDSWSELDDNQQAMYRERTTVVLAAALGVCDVREQWRATDFDGWSYWDTSRDGLAGWVATFGQNGVAYERRLRIATPAEQVDTEGAPA